MAKASNKASLAEPGVYKAPEERSSGWSDFDIRDALRTLSQADKIRKNKALMAAIKAEAKRQLTAAQATHAKLQGGK